MLERNSQSSTQTAKFAADRVQKKLPKISVSEHEMQTRGICRVNVCYNHKS